jgi:1,4-dihydroxy-2-naphthoate octaprenyltransferase
MFLVMLILAVLMLGIGVAGVASVILTFTKYRHSWIVIICALPAFAVGIFYTGGFLLSRRPFSPWFALFWVLLFFGAFSIFRWCYKRP